jgi:WS/DGAT/MGAT family acyltransferase
VVGVTIQRLSADDRLLLLSDRAWPQDVGVLGILDGGHLLGVGGRPTTEVVMAAVARGLPLLPRLRQVLRVPPQGLGGPYWVDDPSFDLDYHVRLGPRLQSEDEAGLLDAVEHIRRHRLDPRRPLWEIWVLPGLDGDRVGMFVRMHHVISDGVAGIASLTTLLRGTRQGGTTEQETWTPAPEPSRRDLLIDSLRHHTQAIGGAVAAIRRPRASFTAITQAWAATRELVTGEPGPVTSLDGLVGAHRRIALVHASLAEVKTVAHSNGATVNDVLLAMTAGGVRALLTGRGEPIDQKSLPILVPVSLRRGPHDSDPGNRISQMVVQLPIGEPDSGVRLRQITAATSRAKTMSHPSMGMVFRNTVLSAILLRRVVRKRINLLTADMVGPTEQLSFAGAAVLDAFPLINLMGNLTLGVGALSYVGRFDVLAVGDAELYPDLDIFAAGAADELRVLGGPNQAPNCLGEHEPSAFPDEDPGDARSAAQTPSRSHSSASRKTVGS